MTTSKYFIISILIFCLCSSCRKNTEYYTNGKIKKEYEYFKGNSEKLCKEYNEAGSLIKRNFYFIGENEEIRMTYNDTNNMISSYKDNIYHGNWYNTTKKGGTIEEYFYVNGMQKLFKKQYYSTNMCMFKVYNVKDMKADLLGEVYYDSTLKFMPGYSTYYNTSLDDRIITIKDTLKINFEFYSDLKDIKIVLGEIDTSFNVLNKANFDTISVTGKNYLFKTLPIKYGINIIQGVIIGNHMFNNDSVRLRRMPVYINYYVVSNQEVKDSLMGFFK